MKHATIRLVFGLCLVSEGQAIEEVAKGHPESSVVWPNSTNAIRFRLYTNGAPDSPHLFNTFELEAYGERLLSSPTGADLKRLLASSPTNALLHSVLVNGAGPELRPANGLVVVERASGPDWCYVALESNNAYRGRLDRYRRGLLYVAPDLFILHDHLVAKEPVSFQMVLHLPAATRLDPVWRDLRLDLPKAGLRINAPSRRVLRAWERVESAADAFLPDTTTMQMGPTNKLNQLDLITVFAVHGGGEKRDYVFKLVESNNAVGARIHREGLPTLVAFKTDPSVERASVTGFGFTGPVGVSAFKPKQKAGQK